MKRYGIWVVALAVGIANALLMKAFEEAVNNGTDKIWNDLFRSDTYRWVVVPLAVALGVLLSLLIRRLGEKRVVPVETDLMDEANVGQVSLRSIAVILAIGLASLLAGASLGPEAALMASSAAMGAWVAQRANLDTAKKLLILASVGALLVAFLGSFVMVLVPLLLMLKRRQLKFKPVAMVLLAGAASFGTIQLVDNVNPGFGTAPPLPSLTERDYLIGLVAGFVTTGIAWTLNHGIELFWKCAQWVENQVAWPVAASIFGLVVGVMYLLGGESIQFSGNGGTGMLVKQSVRDSAAAIAGLLVAKLLVTAWSKGSGYRGGLVFPSLYIGVALGLVIGHLNSGWAGAGALVGGIAGVLSSVTGSPVVAGVFLLAIMPARLLGVALAAIVGTIGGNALLKRLPRCGDLRNL